MSPEGSDTSCLAPPLCRGLGWPEVGDRSVGFLGTAGLGRFPPGGGFTGFSGLLAFRGLSSEGVREAGAGDEGCLWGTLGGERGVLGGRTGLEDEEGGEVVLSGTLFSAALAVILWPCLGGGLRLPGGMADRDGRGGPCSMSPM